MKTKAIIFAATIAMVVVDLAVYLLWGEEALSKFLTGSSSILLFISSICLLIICIHGSRQQEKEEEKDK